MANHYSTAAACNTIRCNVDEAYAISQILADHDNDAWEDDRPEDMHGFEFSFIDGAGLLHSGNKETAVDESNIPEKALKWIAQLFTGNGMSYLEVRISHTTTGDSSANTQGGSEFRILRDGRIEYPEIVWPVSGKWGENPPVDEKA